MLIKTNDKLLLVSFSEARVQEDCLFSLTLSQQGIQNILQLAQYRTEGDILNYSQIDKALSSTGGLAVLLLNPLNKSLWIFRGAQASPALLPLT